MHARRYDASSGRFGVADAVLGALSVPLSLNRYLYCGSDPVNFADPTGHASRSVRLSRGKPVTVNLRTAASKGRLTSWDASARPGLAGVSQVWRDFNMLTGSVQLHATRQGAWGQAWANTKRIVDEARARVGVRYGSAWQGAYEAMVAENYRTHVQRVYCGSAEHLRETAATLHSFAQQYAWLPVASSTADFCGYVAEGDASNSALYGALSLAEILTLGSASFARTGGKLALGAGVKEVSSKAASTLPGGGGKVTNSITRGGLTIQFKHGDRYAIEHGIEPERLDNAAADIVVRMSKEDLMKNDSVKRVTVDGKTFEFTPYYLGDDTVSVGTYRYQK